MIYHAFEVTADGSYDLHVDSDKATCDQRREALLDSYKNDGEPVLSVEIGTVKADTMPDALDKIRAGRWLTSQVLYSN